MKSFRIIRTQEKGAPFAQIKGNESAKRPFKKRGSLQGGGRRTKGKKSPLTPACIIREVMAVHLFRRKGRGTYRGRNWQQLQIRYFLALKYLKEKDETIKRLARQTDIGRERTRGKHGGPIVGGKTSSSSPIKR